MEFVLNLFKFYDLGKPLERSEIIKLINKTNIKTDNIEKYQFDSDKGEPDYINYPEPITLNITQKTKKDEEIEIIAKIFNYGALTIKTELKPEVDDIDGLRKFYEEEEIINRIENLFNRLFNLFHQSFSNNSKKEKYTSKKNFTNLYPVYCISETDYKNVKKLVDDNREEIAGLLLGINDKSNFSEEQINNILKFNTRFYNKDYSIIHWNGTLAIDNEADYDDLLFIIEIANIQFIKLRAYDDYIGNYLSNYLDLSKNRFKRSINFFNPVSKMIKNISRMRVELEHITEMMDNFEKFFGKWYMAKIYYLASGAFEIPRWKKIIESRLDTVDELYTMINNEKNRKKMLFLNFLTLLLFVLWFFI